MALPGGTFGTCCIFVVGTGLGAPDCRSTVVVEGGAAFAELGLKTVEQDGDVQAIMGLWGGA